MFDFLPNVCILCDKDSVNRCNLTSERPQTLPFSIYSFWLTTQIYVISMENWLRPLRKTRRTIKYHTPFLLMQLSPWVSHQISKIVHYCYKKLVFYENTYVGKKTYLFQANDITFVYQITISDQSSPWNSTNEFLLLHKSVFFVKRLYANGSKYDSTPRKLQEIQLVQQHSIVQKFWLRNITNWILFLFNTVLKTACYLWDDCQIDRANRRTEYMKKLEIG